MMGSIRGTATGGGILAALGHDQIRPFLTDRSTTGYRPVAMARPRSFDRGDVEEALLDVFWARGYARASMEELTAAAGILRGSLYAAYAGKEAMFRAAATRYVEQLRAALATNKTGLDGVQHVLDTIVRLTARDPQRRG